MIWAEIDKNFAIQTNIDRDDVVWFNIRKEPFEIFGLYNPKETPEFMRMNDEVAKSVSTGVSVGNYRVSGGRVKFATDSPYIAIKSVQNDMSQGPFFTNAMKNGFDLFSEKKGIYSFENVFVPELNAVGGFEQVKDIRNHTGEVVTYVLNFPIASNLTDLYIGIKANSRLSQGSKYRDINPIVFYGSSVTMGLCASRPGNSYEAIISQKYNLDYINLGFSGNCKAEIPMAEYLRELDMSIFVCDYDYNAPTPEYLEETHFRLYKIFREKQPDTPYIMITKPYPWFSEVVDKRREIIFDSFKKAKALGDKNIYFIDGKDLLGTDCCDNCLIDGVHPNDLGFYRMADGIGQTIKEIISKN
ncbi:MAG: hypothetical protein IKT56_04325 [Clostridia bacterium]|nr:hypothetical protein [Clostridia bacterium]